MTEIIPIYPTSTEYPNTFCPVAILTSYCSECKKLCAVEGEEFLFPKLSSNFEKGGELQLLTISIPPKCIPRDIFHKKFNSHIDSQELRNVGVITSQYSQDSFRLGGIKFMDQNKVVRPDFNNKLDTFPSKKVDTTFPFRKRSLEATTPDRPSVHTAPANL